MLIGMIVDLTKRYNGDKGTKNFNKSFTHYKVQIFMNN